MVVGSQARILYADRQGRIDIALAFNRAIGATARISVRTPSLPSRELVQLAHEARSLARRLSHKPVLAAGQHLTMLETADHIIDLGPEGGDGGGRVVVAGPPEAVAAEPLSHTGVALAGILSGGGRRSSPRSRKAPTKASARKEATWKSA